MKKRIVFVSYNYWPPQFGGELIISIERFQGLAKRGFKVLVLTSGNGILPRVQSDQGLLIYRSPHCGRSLAARFARRMLFILWAMWMLAQLSFDIYYQGNTAGVDPFTAAISVWLNTRIAHWKGAKAFVVHALATTGRSGFDVSGWAGFWRRVLFGCFDVIVVVSPGLYQGLAEVFPQRARLLVNGVRNDIFNPLNSLEREKFRRDAGVSEEQVVFSFLGTVGYRKGFDLLAKAFLELAEKYPHWHLWVIGPHNSKQSQNLDPEEAKQLMALLDPIGQKVTYWGRVDDREGLNKILSASDVFVFPSRREGMGLAPVEAMAAGVPVIIARIPEVTDLASVEGETGCYIPVEDISALRSAMEILACDAGLRAEMGCRAVQRVREGFGWEEHLDRWEGLFLGEKNS